MRGRLIAALFLVGAASGLGQTTADVRVDLTRDLGAFTPIYRWIGYDESNYTTTPNGQALLHELHDLTPEPVYVRAHFLLTTGNGKPELKWSSSNVYSEDATGKPVYDWRILDGIFDAWVGAHVRPFVELGFMPKALSSHPDPYHIPWPTKPGDVEGWSLPPKDYAKWRRVSATRLRRTWSQRYGRAEVSTWYWEVWNEPDIFYWHGTEEEYEQAVRLCGRRREGGDSRGARRGSSDDGTFAGEQKRRVSGGIFAALRAGSQRSNGRADSAGLYFLSREGKPAFCGRPRADGSWA